MRYLFCPLASHGYIYPTISLAQSLQQRGHEIAFATGSYFADLLSELGFWRIPRGEEDGESFFPFKYWNYPFEILRQINHIEYAYSRFEPDVLVASSLALGPLVAARRHQLPVAVVGSASYIWPIQKSRGERFKPLSLADKRVKGVFTTMLELYNDACQAYDLSPITDATYDEHPLLGDLYLHRSVVELEGDIADYPECVHLIGDCNWEPEETFEDASFSVWLEKAVASEAPILYVQHAGLKGIPDFWPGLVEGLADEPVWVAATYSQPIEAPLPDNFFVRPFIPYQAVLPHAAAVIGTGKTSLTLASLIHGLPLLLIMMGASEGELIAERCEQAGVAIFRHAYDSNGALPENVSASNLREAVYELLERDDLTHNAARLQQAFAQVQGPEQGASLLERLGKERRPILRSELDLIAGSLTL